MAPLLECPLLTLSGHHAPKHKTSAMGHKADISRSQHTRPLMTQSGQNKRLTRTTVKCLRSKSGHC